MRAEKIKANEIDYLSLKLPNGTLLLILNFVEHAVEVLAKL